MLAAAGAEVRARATAPSRCARPSAWSRARSRCPPTSPRPPSSSSRRCSCPAASVVLEGVGINPTRTGLLAILERMGAEIEVEPEGERGGEPIGRIRVRAAPLRGTEVGGAEIPLAIDELPLVALAACFAEGDDDDPRRRRAAPQGVRPDRHRERGAERARRRGRADRGRDADRGRRRPARRRDRLPRRPPDRDARRDRRPRLARGVEVEGWTRPRSATPASRPIWPRCSATTADCGPAGHGATPRLYAAAHGHRDRRARRGRQVHRRPRRRGASSASPTSTRGRCIAAWRWRRIERGVDLDDDEAMGELAAALEIGLDGERVLLDGRDVERPRSASPR